MKRVELVRGSRGCILITVGLVIAVAVGGCGRLEQSPTEADLAGLPEVSGPSPVDSGEARAHGNQAGVFFPLEIGNHWSYSGEASVTSGSLPPYVAQIIEERTLVGTENLFGRQYILEEWRRTSDSGSGADTSTFWLRYRQDRAGLYEADVAVTHPPSGMRRAATASGSDALTRHVCAFAPEASREAYREACDRLLARAEVLHLGFSPEAPERLAPAGPPGGVLPDELTRLRYPIRPGQEWTIREYPWFGGVVEAHEVLDLAPARMPGYRIGITNELTGPNDMVFVWYGRDGFLGQSVHLETEILDINGNPIGTLAFDEHLFLDGLDLVGGRWSGEPEMSDGN